MNKIKEEVLTNTKVNRFLGIITLGLFLISLLLNLGFKLEFYRKFTSFSRSTLLLCSIFGLIMFAVLGLYQLIITQLNALDWKEFKGKSSKILKIYNRVLLFYIFSFILGILSSGYLESLLDYSLYSVISKVFIQCYFSYIPLILAIIFTIYIEVLNKELQKK